MPDTTVPKVMVGRIVEDVGGVQTIECTDALNGFDTPDHLRKFFLNGSTRSKLGQVGDTIRLRYEVQPGSGLWYGVEVVRDRRLPPRAEIEMAAGEAKRALLAWRWRGDGQ